MISLVAVLNTIFQTYLQSLKKDLQKRGFEIILLIVVIAWVGIIIMAFLLLIGKFKMPTEPLFYLYWLAVTILATIHYTLFVIGLSKSHFLPANAFAKLGFVIATIYAIIFLGEKVNSMQILAIIMATIGTFFFFEYKKLSSAWLKNNKGLIYVLFSLLISPLSIILYKLATKHTDSYHQFLTGRLSMDLIYYSVFFSILFWLFYKKSPKKHILALTTSRIGVFFMFGTATMGLIDSWLIFLLPISLFKMIGTIAIPTSYFIGRWKYKESINKYNIIGGVLIISAIIIFNLYR